MAGSTCLALTLLCLFPVLTSAIRFYLEPGQRRCFTDELPSSTRITGETRIADGKSDMEIDVWVTTQKGTVLYHRRAADHGKFSFTTPAIAKDHHDDVLEDDEQYSYDDEDPYEEDTFRICIEHQQVPSRAHPAGTRRLVSFVLHQAFNGLKEPAQGAASAEDTDHLQLTMREMHTTLSGMIGDLTQLQRRERNLTARMQRTSWRVTAMAVWSVLMMILTSAVQFKYYQGYFKRKKLC